VRYIVRVVPYSEGFFLFIVSLCLLACLSYINSLGKKCGACRGNTYTHTQSERREGEVQHLGTNNADGIFSHPLFFFFFFFFFFLCIDTLYINAKKKHERVIVLILLTIPSL
jgi:hypothetical protein